jgi:ankyrin repeat protein
MAAIRGRTDVIRILVGDDENTDLAKTIDSKDNNLETPLLLATRMGNADAVRVLAALGKGKSLAIPDRTGKTPTHHAVLNCPQVLAAFIAQDPQALLVKDQDGSTPLHIAASFGRVDAAAIILNAAEGPQRRMEAVEAEDKQLRSPLHCAVENGLNDVVDILVREGSNSPNARIMYEKSAELAAERGHLAIIKNLVKWTDGIEKRLLAAAAGAGQLLIVKHLLHHNVSPDGERSADKRPLGLAASNGHAEVVRVLLDCKANINAVNSRRQTPLHLAAMNDRGDVARILLDYRSNRNDAEHGDQTANIEAPDSARYTPLHYAARSGNVKIMGMLLDRKANVEADSQNLETPLHLAIAHSKAVEMLLNNHARVDSRDLQNRTPLHGATRRKVIESIRLLVQHGADIDRMDDEGKHPADIALEDGNRLVVQEIFQLRSEDQSSSQNLKGYLSTAVGCSTLEIIKFLLEKFPETAKAKAVEGERSMLHIAAQRGSEEILDYLIQPGLDVNHYDDSGETPLHVAAYSGQVEAMKKLIQSGAEINKPAEDGDMAIHFTAMQRSVEACSYLLGAGASVDALGNRKRTALFYACYHGNLRIVQKLLEHDADPNLRQNNGWSSLHAAADNLDITRLLVKKRAKINYQKSDKWTPLHLAANWDRPSVVEFLLQNGADPDIVNDDGDGPLHLALRKSFDKVLQVMIDHKGDNAIDFNKRGSQGQLPIHLAAKHDKNKCLQMLRGKGLDLEFKAENDLSCLELAVEARNNHSLSILLESVDGDPQDVGDAYWAAVGNVRMNLKGLRLLIERNDDLLNKISRLGWNGFETYMHSERGLEDEALLLAFLNLGFNPFQRREGQKSAFELGIISRRTVNLTFLERCLKILPSDLHMSGLGFPELRIATELDDKGAWNALKALTEHVEGKSDHDGWNIDHFLFQSANRLFFANWERSAIKKKTRKPTALIRPDFWRSQDRDYEDRVEIIGNGLEATITR